MAKVVFCLFGNLLTSLTTSKVAEKIIKEEYGIKKIGKAGFPVTICHHGLETEMFPFLLENPSKYSNIETMSTTFSHSLIGILNDADKKFQIKNGTEGNSGVFFFPDYVNPRPNIIKEKFFLYLGDQKETFNPYAQELSSNPEKHLAISFDNKIGIPIDGCRDFLNAWNKHAAIPNKKNLTFLFEKFEKICNDKEREFVIIPINFEQPYIGSVLGEKLWEIFFKELSKNRYKDNVVPLSSILEYCEKTAIKKRPPTRITVKWAFYQNQKQIFTEMNSIKMPTDSKKYYKAGIIKSIAYLADYFTSIGRRTAHLEENFPVIECQDLKGKKYKTKLKWNQDLEEICNAARKAIRTKQKFSTVLEKLDNNFLVKTFRDYSKKLSL